MDFDRETAVGFFNVAHSYCVAALAVDESELECTHGDLPAKWLCYHSLELYLKSFLLRQGFKSKELAKEYGHQLPKLLSTAKQNGLIVHSQYGRIIEIVQQEGNAIEARYLKIGSKRQIKFRALVATCYHLHFAIVESVYELCPNITRRPVLPEIQCSELVELKLPSIF